MQQTYPKAAGHDKETNKICTEGTAGLEAIPTRSNEPNR